MLRVEKVEYTVEIPKNVRKKLAYAEEQLLEGNYIASTVVDIPVSKMLEEEIHSLRKAK